MTNWERRASSTQLPLIRVAKPMIDVSRWVLRGAVPPHLVGAQLYCLLLVSMCRVHVASLDVRAAHAYEDLRTIKSHYEIGHYCSDSIVQYVFTVDQMRLLLRPLGTENRAAAERLLLLGQKVFNCIVERASAFSSSTEASHGWRPVSQWSAAYTTDEFPAFGVKHASLPGLQEVYQIRFYCKSQEARDATILTCSPRPNTLPGSMTLRLDFELLSPTIAKERSPWCRITHNVISLSIFSFLEAAAGLCTTFGYNAQLLCNEGFAVGDLIPGLDHLGSAALGFQLQPARYSPSPQPFFLAGVKPTSDKPSDKHTDRGAAQFESRHQEGFEAWFGVAISRHLFDDALRGITGAFKAAVMTDERTSVGDDCVMRIAIPPEHAELFRNVGGGACTSSSPFLTCVQALQNELSPRGYTDALSTLLSEVKNLIPNVRPSNARMLRILSAPRSWRLLHALIGPTTARSFETPEQTAWYEAAKHESRAPVSSKTPDSLQASSESVASELFRFAIWYVDIFPSRKYWESLELGCIRKDLAYLNIMGKLRTRQSSLLEALKAENQEDLPPPLSMLQVGSDPQNESADTFKQGAEVDEEEHRRLTQKAAVILRHGQEVKPLQFQYSFEELRAVSDLNPPESESDEELRTQWLASPLFEGQGYITIKDVPARDGGLFDLKIVCSKTGQFRRTRLTGWFSSYLCEPDYMIVPNNDVKGIWRKDDMPVNRMIGIEFESHSPWRCGVSFLGDEHSLRETPVRAKHLLIIMTGLCSLSGFKTGWVLDSVHDLYTKEMMKITMILEKRVSFYESHGFLLSVNTLKSRRRAETCVGSSLHEGRRPLVGACHHPHDILINPGFEWTALTTLATKAYNTLYTVTFDCNSPLWKNCGQLYPLSVVDHRGNGCAFERHPLFQELKYLKPDKCNIGKRIGDCHMYVRKTLKCDRHHKKGCKYLAFLYSTFLHPGEDIEEELPSVMRDHFEDVSADLFREGRRYILDGINKATESLLDDLATRRREETGEAETVSEKTDKDLNNSLLQPWKQDEIDTRDMQNMLLESVIFHDWTNTPQFWIRALHHYALDKIGLDDVDRVYCPVGYAWAYITRVQGQLYRRPSLQKTC